MFRSIHRLQFPLTALYSRRWASGGPQSFAADSRPGGATVSKNKHRTVQSNDEIADLMAVESSLFGNGNRNNNAPIDAKKLLASYAPKSKHGNINRFRKKPESPSPSSVVSKPVKPPAVKSDIVNNTALGLTYTKLHLNDPRLNTLLLSVKSRKSRSLKHQLLVEGRRLIVEAIQCGLPLEHILFSDIEQLQKLQQLEPSAVAAAALVKVPQGDLRVWSNLSTCPGLMAVFVKPADLAETINEHRRRQQEATPNAQPLQQRLPVTVICDQIREPNNVGAIIRNCAAADCEQVIVTKGCADPWETKALRGGAGAQFKIPVRGPCDWSSIRSLLPSDDVHVFLAENSRNNAVLGLRNDDIELDDVEQKTANDGIVNDVLRVYSDVNYASGKHCVVLIGGETEGLSADAYKLLRRNVLGHCVHIPLAGNVESLNTGAALAIILFEIRKQFLADRAKNAI